jgi:hypothetical protein
MKRESKTATDYTSVAADMKERCERCSHFRRPDSCEIVIGAISPKGWCKRFRAK